MYVTVTLTRSANRLRLLPRNDPLSRNFFPTCYYCPPCTQADIGDFAKVNTIYATYFTEQPPARATFAVKDLPLGAQVEIDAVAVLP